MKCGFCKEKGVDVAHVRQCAGDRYGAQGHPAEAPRAADAATVPERKTRWEVPAGRYAILYPNAEGRKVLKFFHVDKPTEGRWVGYTFVKEQASDDLYPVKDRARREDILATIAEDPREAIVRYGREIGKCGVCGRTLTEEESRAYGIGPVCRTKVRFL